MTDTNIPYICRLNLCMFNARHEYTLHMQTQFMHVQCQTRIYPTYADSIYACAMTDTNIPYICRLNLCMFNDRHEYTLHMQTQFIHVQCQTRIYPTYADSIYACSMKPTNIPYICRLNLCMVSEGMNMPYICRLNLCMFNARHEYTLHMQTQFMHVQ